MRAIRIIGAGALLAVVSTAALAFQEQQQGAAPGKAAPAAEQPAPNLGMPPDSAVKTPGSTEVRIPGLGKLGVLPKLDLGLELLYGAAEGKPVERERPGGPAPADDLSIRGTLKHRF